MKTLAEHLKAEEEALRRRFVHHTRPKGPLSLKEAIELSERMQGPAPVIEPFPVSQDLARLIDMREHIEAVARKAVCSCPQCVVG